MYILLPAFYHQFIHSSGTTRRWWESVPSCDLPYVLHTIELMTLNTDTDPSDVTVNAAIILSQ